MKNSSLLSALVLGAALILNGAGCKHKAPGTTLIPGPNVRAGSDKPSGSGDNGNINVAPVVLPPTDTTSSGPASAIDPKSKYGPTLNDGEADRNKFASETVYFDTDSSAIKTSEQAKLQTVADYFKNNLSNEALRVEGYCDERGTEQYNVALGDRRANAIRDYLANLGIDAQRVMSVSFGEANPVATGHDESAWKQNRRGVFVLMKPKQ